MAIAGKVAITPKGEWNANTTYEKLDLVFYENASYVATKPSTGVSPTDESYWMLVVQSAGGADLEAIIDGATQVGNAKTLDGHEADYFAKETDLAKYLPLTGGIVGGNLEAVVLEDVDVYTGVRNKKRRVYQHVNGTSGIFRLFDWTNQKAIIESLLDGTNTFNGTASGNLPLSGGGIVSKNGVKVMGIHNTNALYTLFDFYGTGTLLGSLGLDGVNNPVFRPIEGSAKQLLHTGNKPSGSYTGNGSAEQRTITTGATSEAIIVKEVGTNNFAVVVSTGWFGVKNGVFDSGSDAYLYASNIVLRSTSELFNKSGAEYRYSCL